MSKQPFQRDKDGTRMQFLGMNTVSPPDQLAPGKFPYAANLRAYLRDAVTGRAVQDSSTVTLPYPVHSIRRLNDATGASVQITYIANGISGGFGTLTTLEMNIDRVGSIQIGSFVTFMGITNHPEYNGVTRQVAGIGSNANGPLLIFDTIGGSLPAFTFEADTGSVNLASGSAFILVEGAGTRLYANSVQVDSGLSGNPISLVPFRPAASVQPWMYVGDSFKMDKVRSDNTRYAMGVMEPQVTPTVTGTVISDQLSTVGPVQTYVWNAANGSSSSTNGTPDFFKNPTDVAGRGPSETIATAALVVSGNSFAFDEGVSPGGSYSIPVKWLQYTIDIGSVNTSGVNVTWVAGDQFSNIIAGQKVIINAVTYTVAAAPAPTNTTFSTTVSAGTQTAVAYYASVPSGSFPLYTPALSSSGYVFNSASLGTLYVPTAGSYTFTATYVNDILIGIGNSGTGKATWPGASGAATISNSGQTKTIVNGYPLIPRTTTIDGNGYSQGTMSISVTFSQPGNYPIEVDWNYGNSQHSSPNRVMWIHVNGADIAPLPTTAITNAQYRYVYRSSATGAVSNPSPESAAQSLSTISNKVSATPSTDPQVDKIDFYRLDAGLTSFTYIGTGPNTSAAFSDTLLDADVAANPLLEFDNYQPFPSIDLPHKGTVTVAGGVATWVSGDLFNVRWLAGTIIIVGTVAYTLDKRPTSPTSLTASNTEIIGGVSVITPLADGTTVTYEIAEPVLAAQPLPYMWGPTDNIAFFFAVGDPLRPGTLYWSKGNNPDSAPDTNQEDITSPSEVLQNGVITNGIGLVMSTERGFLIYPNYFNALATVQGTVGSTWTIQESIANRGLYLPNAICVDGGGNVYFRAKDGIYASPGGQGSKSITDADIYNLFPHEGFVPHAVGIGPFVVYPPDDTKPLAQRLNVANGFLYYDYLDTTNVQRTLVMEIATGGWSVDVYQFPPLVHVLEEGAGVNGVLLGCTDGSIRPLVDSGAETATSVLLMPCMNAGDGRAQKRWGDCFIEAGPLGG